MMDEITVGDSDIISDRFSKVLSFMLATTSSKNADKSISRAMEDGFDMNGFVQFMY